MNPTVLEVGIQETFNEQGSRMHKGSAVEEASMHHPFLQQHALNSHCVPRMLLSGTRDAKRNKT